MTHEEVQRRLPAFRLNDLSPAETAAVFEHIAECATCRVDLGRIGATLGLLQRAATELPAEETERDVVAAIMAPILGPDAEPARRRLRLRIARMTPARWVAIAAAVTIVALSSTLIYSYLEANERSRRINCSGNLEQLGLAFRISNSDTDATSAPAEFDMWETERPPAAGVPLSPPGDDEEDEDATVRDPVWRRAPSIPPQPPRPKGGATPMPPSLPAAEPAALGDLPALGALYKDRDDRKPISDRDGFFFDFEEPAVASRTVAGSSKEQELSMSRAKHSGSPGTGSFVVRDVGHRQTGGRSAVRTGERNSVLPRPEGHTSLTTNGRIAGAKDQSVIRDSAEAGGYDGFDGGDFGGGVGEPGEKPEKLAEHLVAKSRLRDAEVATKADSASADDGFGVTLGGGEAAGTGAKQPTGGEEMVELKVDLPRPSFIGTPKSFRRGSNGGPRPLAPGEGEVGNGSVDDMRGYDFTNGGGREWGGIVNGDVTAAVVDTGVTRWHRGLASPEGSLPPGGDEDSDGLTNMAEHILGTSPFLADTDDDVAGDVSEFDVRSEQKKVEYENLVNLEDVQVANTAKEHETNLALGQGDVVSARRQFAQAPGEHKEALATDPLDVREVKGLVAIDERLSDLSPEEKRKALTPDRIADVRWKWEEPVPTDGTGIVAARGSGATAGELPSAPREPPPPVNPFVLTAKDRLSTFALEADTAAYALTRRYIRKGYRPPPAVVRMEEFVNAFDYNYPSQAERTFTVQAEAAPAPFGRGLTLLKIGVRGKVLGRDGRKPAHLVFVVDASGSMAREDRMPLVKHALSLLVDQLGEQDRVTLIAYGTQARLMLEAAPAKDTVSIRRAVESVACGTSTNIQAGIELAYELAARHFRAGEVNRIILCSDGVANVGPSDAESLLAKVEKYRDQGITFTSVGVGAGSYDDRMLEQLANKGDGNYVFVDSRAEARRVFVDDMSATLQTIAKDVKIQVEFNPERVRRYRLIGYENRDVADKDFRNDAVDAGEIGSGQSATALYELELVGGNAERVPDLGTVCVRCRNLDNGEIEEISSRLTNALIARRTPESDPRFFLAACVAEFAEILRGSEHARDGSLPGIEQAMIRVANALPLDERVQEFLELIRQSRGLPQAK